MILKCSFLFLALIGMTYGAEITSSLDAEDSAIEMRKICHSSIQRQDAQSTEIWEDLSNSSVVLPERGLPVVSSSQTDLDHTIDNLQPIITLGIIAAFAVSGYFLVKYVYDLLYSQYSPPGFSPVSGGWGSSCAEMRLPPACTCYGLTVAYSPPLDFSAIANYLSDIQRSCSLSNETLFEINEHLVSAWTEINGGEGSNNYISTQCQNESFVKDYVRVAHFPAKHGISSHPAHTDLIVSVGSYAAACLAPNNPMFGGAIAGWTFACIFTLIIQCCIYGCFVG